MMVSATPLMPWPIGHPSISPGFEHLDRHKRMIAKLPDGFVSTGIARPKMQPSMPLIPLPAVLGLANSGTISLTCDRLTDAWRLALLLKRAQLCDDLPTLCVRQARPRRQAASQVALPQEPLQVTIGRVLDLIRLQRRLLLAVARSIGPMALRAVLLIDCSATLDGVVRV